LKKDAANQTLSSQDIAAAASFLVLISSIINNLNTATAKRDDIYVVAGTIGLITNFLFKEAALKEASEQQIAPGVTTLANELKVISSSIGLISGILSYLALIIEVSLKAQGISAPKTPSAQWDSSITGSLLV